MRPQITRTAGRLLIELDISNCLTLTDKSCSSIARHCKCVEVLGLRNLREVKGTELSEFFLDGRAKHFRVATLSGTKNVSCCSLCHYPKSSSLFVAEIVEQYIRHNS